MDPNFQRELLSFEEKIKLAELEEAKAHERVKMLEYDKARFNLEYFLAAVKQQQEQKAAKTAATPGKTEVLNAQ
jgi:hypothetical protein